MSTTRARRGPPPERDRAAIRAGMARHADAERPTASAEPLPGWCQGCRARVWLFLNPIRWADEYGRQHRCER